MRTLDAAESLYEAMRCAGGGDGDRVSCSLEFVCKVSLIGTARQTLDLALLLLLCMLASDGRSIEPLLFRRGKECFAVVVCVLLRDNDNRFVKTSKLDQRMVGDELKQEAELSCLIELDLNSVKKLETYFAPQSSEVRARRYAPIYS